jgi:PAS domain S-box-containing protein
MNISSIRFKITLGALIPIFILGFLTSIGIFFQVKSTLSNSITQSILSTVKRKAVEQEQTLSISQQIAYQISINDQVKSFFSHKSEIREETKEKNDSVEMNNYLENFNINQMFSAIYLMDKYGLTIASTQNDFLNKNYSFRRYFQEALREGQAMDTAVGATSGELGIYFAQRVEIDGEILGVVVAKLKPEIMSQLLLNDISTEETLDDIWLVDRYGVIIAASQDDQLYYSLSTLSEDQYQELEKYKNYPNIRNNSLNKSELKQLIEINQSQQIQNSHDEETQDPVVNSVVKIKNYPLFLLASKNIVEVNYSAVKNSLFVAATVFSAALLAFGGIYLLVSKFLQPVPKVIAAVEKIGKGDFDFDLTETMQRKDEVGLVARSFMTMISSLKKSRAEIDAKVAQQTEQINNNLSKLNDQRRAILNVLEDVEEEKKEVELKSQELKKFQMAVANASDHIVITDIDGRIIYANPSVEKLTGYSFKETKGKKAGSKELWGGLMDLSFYKKLWKTIKEDKKVFSGEVTNRRKNGQKYTAMASISPVLDDKGEINFFIGIERDMTREKEIDRMKTEFISLASHQLRTPLSAMKWFLEMLLDGDAGELNKEQKEMIDNIDQSNQRMIALVNGLLNISRIESGRIIIDPKPTNILTLIDELLKELDSLIKEKDLQVVVSKNENLDEIMLDPSLVIEVYRNLLTNAIKYTPHGGEITVLVSRNDKEVISQITDTGLGIPKDEFKKVFEKFHRAANVLKTETDGTGLGLYLTKAIVESCNGKIWFESQENKGTSFWFTLPLNGMKAKKGEVKLGENHVIAKSEVKKNSQNDTKKEANKKKDQTL